MEIWSGHDLNHDGKNDIYIRHEIKPEQLQGIGMLCLYVIGFFTLPVLSVAWMFLFDNSDDKAGLIVLYSFGAGIPLTLALIYGFVADIPQKAAIWLGVLVVGYFAAGPMVIAISNKVEETAKANEERRRLGQAALDSKRYQEDKARGKAILDKIDIELKSRGWKLTRDTSSIETLSSNDFSGRATMMYGHLGYSLFIDLQPNLYVNYRIDTQFPSARVSGRTYSVPGHGGAWSRHVSEAVNQEMLRYGDGSCWFDEVPINQLKEGYLLQCVTSIDQIVRQCSQ
jgi:hypothetical protein